MSPYATAGWETFFVAEVGAAAALTGLLFVAVSINLTKVLAFPQLPGRAAESLMMLAAVLVVASLGLIPGQSRVALGAEILAMLVGDLASIRRVTRRSTKITSAGRRSISRARRTATSSPVATNRAADSSMSR